MNLHPTVDDVSLRKSRPEWRAVQQSQDASTTPQLVDAIDKLIAIADEVAIGQQAAQVLLPAVNDLRKVRERVTGTRSRNTIPFDEQRRVEEAFAEYTIVSEMDKAIIIGRGNFWVLLSATTGLGSVWAVQVVFETPTHRELFMAEAAKMEFFGSRTRYDMGGGLIGSVGGFLKDWKNN